VSGRDGVPPVDAARESAGAGALPPPHVWGPVMVISWAGPRECAEALAAARADSGCAAIRAIVLGAGAIGDDAAALWPLLDTLAALRAAGIETVVAGLGVEALRQLAALLPPLERPFAAPDVPSAIALAFQAVG
jgi:hypothetical protein